MGDLTIIVEQGINQQVKLFRLNKAISYSPVLMVKDPMKVDNLRKTVGSLGMEILTRLFASFSDIGHISITLHHIQIALRDDAKSDWDELEPQIKALLINIIK